MKNCLRSSRLDVSLYIARRYLISKKSNNAINIISWISIVAIAVTTGALVIILSAMNGLTGVVADLYNGIEPDIRVSATEGKYFPDDANTVSKIRALDGVKLVCRSLSDKALIKNVDKQALVTVKGVDEVFPQITRIDSAITEGRNGLADKGTPIIIGRGLANQLHVNLHVFVNELSVFSPERGSSDHSIVDGQLNQLYCTPTGIFSLNDELDYQLAYTKLQSAQTLFDLSGKISALEISCEEGKTEKVQTELKALLGPAFTVKNRYELNDVLFKSLETEKLATFFILAFILVIATFNIIGALTMLIIEKKKDIRTLFSMGASLPLIRNIFMREAFLICGIGALGGLLIGLFICWLQMHFHLVTFGSEFIIPYYPVELQASDFLKIFVLIMVIGFVAALYPIRVFTRTDLVH